MSRRTKIAAAAILILNKRSKEKRNKKKRSVWVRNWVWERERKGLFTNLLKELQEEDRKSYTNFLRMSHEDYEYLLRKVEPMIKRKDTHLRRAISASERLTLTLRFLATGDSYHSLSYLFRIPVTTIARIIPDVCEAIFKGLKADYLQVRKLHNNLLIDTDLFRCLNGFADCSLEKMFRMSETDVMYLRSKVQKCLL